MFTKIKQTIRVYDKCQQCKESIISKTLCQCIVPIETMDIVSVDHLRPFPSGYLYMYEVFICVC